MTNETDQLLHRVHDVLAKLEQLIPSTEEINWDECLAVRVISNKFSCSMEVIEDIDPITLDDLLEIDRQKEVIAQNTNQFCRGFPANNALLWGARGTGKSSLIHALLNKFATSGLRIVEVDKKALSDIAWMASKIKTAPYRFLIVADDLSFEVNDPSYKQLKSALDGSIVTTLNNVLIYATSNRRHLMPESMQDNFAASYQQGELHQSEAVEESVSLSDRFGLWLSFHPFKQSQYLAVAQYWLERLADQHGIRHAWDNDIEREALQWALYRGVRSGRTANHFARHWIGKHLLS